MRGNSRQLSFHAERFIWLQRGPDYPVGRMVGLHKTAIPGQSSLGSVLRVRIQGHVVDCGAWNAASPMRICRSGALNGESRAGRCRSGALNGESRAGTCRSGALNAEPPMRICRSGALSAGSPMRICRFLIWIGVFPASFPTGAMPFRHAKCEGNLCVSTCHGRRDCV